MKKFILIFSLFTLSVSAQEPVGTIKIKREQNLVKAGFDNVEYKLMAIDRFGNPQENTFASYTLWIKKKKNQQKNLRVIQTP